ncbi:MAG: ROK family protein [Candidatus Peregrinibacteria bacterium]
MAEALHIASGDLGGSNCRSAIVTYNGNEASIDKNTYRSWDSKDERDFDRVLNNSIGETVRGFHGKIAGVALAVAGPIPDHRTVLSAANTPCLHHRTPYDIAATLEQTFDVESIAANDVEAAAAGEVAKGALQGKKWARLENIGTGWGGAAILDGMAVSLEPGHVWLPKNGALCGCGKRDCAEATLSGGAIRKRLIEMDQAGAITLPEGIDPCAFADQQALENVQWAVEFYTEIAHDIGNIWGSNLNNCPLMTDIVYMGSFLVRAMQIEFFRQQIREAMLTRTMFPEQHANVKIQEVSAPRLASGESLGPIYGAASIWKRLHDEHEGA